MANNNNEIVADSTITVTNNNQDQKKKTYHRLVNRAKHPHIIKLKGGENVFIAAHGTIDMIDPDSIAEDFTLPNTVHSVKFEV